jgi:hypothetical protein
MNYIVGTCWKPKTIWYVRDVPRKLKLPNGKYVPKPGYADWEYTENYGEAKPLSLYWMRRFRADMAYCGHCFHSWEA